MSRCCVDGAATQFPQGTGVAATWNRQLVFAMGVASSDESRALMAWPNRSTDYRTGASSVINILRDGRWGRAPETYGECPQLTGDIAVALNKGLMGFVSVDSASRVHDRIKVLPTIRHFVAYAGPDSKRFGFYAQVSDDDLRLTYLPAWHQLVRAGAIGGVMSAISGLNGVPSASQRSMLTDVLRGEWNFEGFVVSDCDNIGAIAQDFHYASTVEEAAALAIKAGGDLNCGPEYAQLLNASRHGLVTEAELDVSVERLLRARAQVGDLDPAGQDPWSHIPLSVVDSPAHRALARQVVAESLVLLENGLRAGGSKRVLPLSATGRIAVVGPSADDLAVQAHTYHGTPSRWITILDGIKELVGSGASVVSAPGCDRTGSDTSRIAAAAALAASADSVVFVGGLQASMEEEGTDRVDSISLPGVQLELIRALQATGKPLAVVIISGGPVAEPSLQQAPNLALAWVSYFGQDGGGVAQVLFGTTSPSGRLPFTIPRDVSQLGNIEDYALTGGPHGRTYRYLNYSNPAAAPLYPFAYGLGYDNITVQALSLNTSRATVMDSVQVHVSIANHGPGDASHVVALFGSFLAADGESASPVTALPKRDLLGHDKMTIGAGQTATTEFALQLDQLPGIYRQPLPGVLRLWVGDGGICSDCPSAALQLVLDL